MHLIVNEIIVEQLVSIALVLIRGHESNISILLAVLRRYYKPIILRTKFSRFIRLNLFRLKESGFKCKT